MKHLLTTLTCLLLLSGCGSLQRLLDSGDYDTVIEKSVKKLTGRRKKEDYVQALETAFARANRRDIAALESLRNENRTQSWEQALRIVDGINRRQARVQPLLPLVSDDGYQARVDMVNTASFAAEARQGAERLYAEKLTELTGLARQGNKEAARDAWRITERMRALNSDKDQRLLREELRDLGIVHVLLALDNESRTILPAGLARELLASDLNRNGGEWTRFYTREDPQRGYDVLAELRVSDVNVSPERWREQSKAYTKTIKDGWEYVLDNRGNVRKDSLGNDIKRDKYIEIKATVVETTQEKAALVRARVEITELATGKVLASRPIQFEQRFEHLARTIAGDDRALDSRTSKRIAPVSYPPDTEMITGALFGLKPMFLQVVRSTRYP